MMPSKADFRGTKKVFSFTLFQLLKNKGNIVSLIFLILMSAAMIPIMAIVNKAAPADIGHSEITGVYISNLSDVEADWDQIARIDGFFAGVPFKEEDGLTEDDLGMREVLLTVDGSAAGGYMLEAVCIPVTDLSEDEVDQLLDAARQVFEQARYEALGIGEEQLAMLTGGFTTSVSTVEEYENQDKTDFDTRYFLQLAYSIFVMMLSIMSVSYIVRSIVEEKASKLVELLMVSVRPLALIAGKILASMAFVFGMFAAMIIAAAASYVITGQFLDLSAGFATIGGLDLGGLFAALTPLSVISVLISLITGFLTFALIAGLFGSACSSTSETESAIMVPTLIVMLGYIVSCAVSGFDGGPVVVVCSLCPVISVFCAPVQYLIGNIGFGVLTGAWVLQLIVAGLLSLFCAKIYNELIIHRGSRVKLGEMFAMARSSGRTK